jgi:release factor glutamine methyltransferase
VLGDWDFRRLTLKVDSRALVPRPETEILVERCLALIDGIAEPHVLDVGTGNGAIALSIAHEHPGANVIAIDVSADALALARENAEATGLAGSVRFMEGDLYDGLGADAYDLVVSNPPYVTEDEIQIVQPEVREWEPRLAVVGGTQTRAVAEAARDALRPDGHLVLEVADERAEDAAALLEELGYDDVRLTQDLTGRERIAEGRWAS